MDIIQNLDIFHSAGFVFDQEIFTVLRCCYNNKFYVAKIDTSLLELDIEWVLLLQSQ
jgi:hypothetical protein